MDRRDFIRVLGGSLVASVIGCGKDKPIEDVVNQQVVENVASEVTREYLHRVSVKHGDQKQLEQYLDVQFVQGSDSISKLVLPQITQYVRSLGRTKFLLESHTGSGTSEESREELAKLRGWATSNPVINGGSSIDIAVYENGKENNFVRIIEKGKEVVRGLDLSPADVYLIDGSHHIDNSEHGFKGNFDFIKDYNFPVSSEVYLFTPQKPNSETQLSENNSRPINNIYPRGNDSSLYSSLLESIQLANPGQKITVVAACDDNSGKVNPTTIVKEARAKNVTISFVDLGTYNNGPGIDFISKFTGGSVYRSD